ncbi:alkaline shock response membrane anchor protein AmaP [Streptomyces sp. TRM43335]|uniref:Alkaline shock response membrane anchor protein AmaP n=1 Tax=Streptomyces taklimakanensis TaxID=2569853 RepID=A0A6G2B6A0_9ACTN|nr:alkaline shock response membrane anchor protein AmaP [Streptomyces taklimakanensis]MTE17787.1 alkaline shock response membrane anchor protein AmaP [Streptomyces taklimakanensis]
MLAVVNRVLLALLGLLVLAAGLAVLAGGLDLWRRWDLGPPSAWPWSTPREVLLDRGSPAWWGEAGWWRWLVAIGVPAVLLLLALWWLQAQLRRHRLDRVRVDTGDGHDALVEAPALEDAVVAEARSLPGVERGKVTLDRRRNRPWARVALELAPHAAPARVLADLRDGPLEHARVSAGLDALPAEVRLRSARHRTERVD